MIKKKFPRTQHPLDTSLIGFRVTLVKPPSSERSVFLFNFFSLAGYSGVGLLTKIDPIDVKYGIGVAEHDAEGRVITAEYEKFYLVVSYIPNSGRQLARLEYRQQFNEAFRKYLKELDEKKPAIW